MEGNVLLSSLHRDTNCLTENLKTSRDSALRSALALLALGWLVYLTTTTEPLLCEFVIEMARMPSAVPKFALYQTLLSFLYGRYAIFTCSGGLP